MPPITTPLISAIELKQVLDHKNLVLLDASWYMPAMKRDGYTEWQQQRIANAQHLDFHEKICDSTSVYPHTMPSAQLFTEHVQALGVNKESHIVVYDGMGLFASPRVWWMFKAMGHDNISVLNGGLPAWIQAAFPINKEVPIKAERGDFVATLKQDKFTTAESILASINSDDIIVVDARSKSRFEGTETEPRSGIRSGHIPNAKNLPFTDLLDGGYLRSHTELDEQLSTIASAEQTMVFTCGSGVTACHLALAAEICGYDKLSVFDGSWSEWGARHELPISTGK